MPPVQLSPDQTFHFELLRIIAHARYSGSDIGEVLVAASQLIPGDFESWYRAFNSLALRVLAQIPTDPSTSSAATIRDLNFHASNYFRCADFFLHGNPLKPNDARIDETWVQQAAYFDKAMALLPIPGKRLTLQADGFKVPAIFYPASKDLDIKLPVVLMGNGYDGAQEELLHVCVLAALERGYHVITYEGPGQPTVRRSQNLAFMPAWDKVVTPVVDYLFEQSNVDTSKIALFGYSMGGFLSVRAAAREPRITAVIAIDGVYSLFSSFLKTLPEPLISWFNNGKKAELDAAITGMLSSAKSSTNARWAVGQGLWSFNTTSTYDLLVAAKAFTLDGFVEDVKCKVFVGDAENDHFFDGQPELMAKALGDRATYFLFKDEDGAGEHCHIGAAVRMNTVMFDWLIKVWGA